MNKKILIFCLTLLLCLGLLYNQAQAKKDDASEPELPEKNGVYPVRGRPELKLRVFVHGPRNDQKGKPVPSPTPSPILNCSLQDPDSSEVDAIEKWHLPTEFSYYLNSSSVPAFVGPQNLNDIANKSFTEWTEAISNKVILRNVGETTAIRARLDGLNIVSWGKASSGTLGITYIWYYTSTGLVAEVDTIMNKGYPWSWSDSATCAYSASYDAQNILTHELGHWFGVDDNYETVFKDNTMYGYGAKEETKKDTLTSGDITAAKGIYLQN